MVSGTQQLCGSVSVTVDVTVLTYTPSVVNSHGLRRLGERSALLSWEKGEGDSALVSGYGAGSQGIG